MSLLSGNKAFMIIMVVGVMAVVMLVSWAVIDIGCGEAIQTRVRNDYVAANYLALAATERMYARLSSQELTVGQLTWPVTISSTNVQMDGTTVGSYSVNAYLTGEAGVFMISSTGTVNGRTSRVTVKYGYSSNYTNGYPVGSAGPMDMDGQRVRILFWWVTSWVYADGPIESASGITPSGMPNSDYVQYFGTVTQNSAGIVPISYWLGQTFDTNNDTNLLIDSDSSGDISLAEAQAQQAGGDPNALVTFAADDVNADNTINDADAFDYYYTDYYNQAANNPTGADLGISGPGDTAYYSGNQTFGPGGIFFDTVPAGTDIIYVDGDVNIVLNAQSYWGSESDLTIVSTGDITIVQPVNGSDDRLNLIAQGDIYTGGINLGDLADIDGNLNMVTMDDFVAVLGGSTNGSIFANGNVDVHTGLPSFLFNRDLNKGTDNWGIEGVPLGMPPLYRILTQLDTFVIKAENLGTDPATSYKPRWQTH